MATKLDMHKIMFTVYWQFICNDYDVSDGRTILLFNQSETFLQLLWTIPLFNQSETNPCLFRTAH